MNDLPQPEERKDRRLHFYCILRESQAKSAEKHGPATQLGECRRFAADFEGGGHEVSEAFTEMGDAWDEIAAVFRNLNQDKFIDRKQVDSEKVEEDSAQAAKHFGAGMAKFYKRLDAIREAAAS